jgi:hypothetical protein
MRPSTSPYSVGVPKAGSFAAEYPARTYPCQRFDAALASGTVASSLVGLVYLAMPLAGIFWLGRRRIDTRTLKTATKYIVVLVALLLDGFIISELLGLDVLLTFVSAGIVLSFLALGSILPAFKICEILKRRF